MASRAPRGGLIQDWRDSRGARGVAQMGRVVYALTLRESRTRYGKSDIGYAWALIDPVVELLVLWAVFVALARHVPIATSLPVFLVTGIVPYYFWKDCTTRCAAAINSNLPLLTYPQVRPADTVLARVVLEAVTTLIVVIILIIGLNILYGEPFSSWFDEPVRQIEALAALFYFGMSFAFLSSGISRIFPPWEEIFSYFSRPLWFTSGVFFTLESLGRGIRQYAELNPIAHMIEWIRSATLPGFESESYSRMFVLETATVVLFIGLALDRLLTIMGHTDQSH